MPAALFANPDLVATTPPDVLLASAMNGFDKGIETLYSHRATPFTDATASLGLKILRTSLPALGSGRRDDRTMERVVVRNLLVQYGGAQPAGRTMSVIHAFGNGLSKGYDLQQGVAHGIAAPHALEYVFDHVDACQHVIADALGATMKADPDGVANLVVAAVAAIHDALTCPPSYGRTGTRHDELDAVAESIPSNRFMENTLLGLNPTTEEMEDVLKAMW